MSASLDDFCPTCGYRKPPGAAACPDCGTRFAPPAPEPAPPPAATSGEWHEVRRPAEPPPAPAAASSRAEAGERAAAGPAPPAPPSSSPASSPPAAVPAPAVPSPPAAAAPPPAAPAAPRVRTPLTAALLGAVPPEEKGDAEPPGYATVWPPVSAVRKAAPAPEPVAEAPAPAPLPPAAPVVPPVEPPPPAVPPDMAQPKPPPPPPREPRRLDRRVVGVGAAVLLIALAALTLALIPHGASHPRQAAALGTPTQTATATPKPAPRLAAQVASLDALMRFSERGRAAAVKGDFAAAAANRATLLRRVNALRAHVRDATLRAGLTSLAAAVREALDENRTCKGACSTEELARVGRLKRQALGRLNPLLRRYAHTSYKRAQI